MVDSGFRGLGEKSRRSGDCRSEPSGSVNGAAGLEGGRGDQGGFGVSADGQRPSLQARPLALRLCGIRLAALDI